ncbi:MAG: hypothetical protein L3J83_08160 [Proteobacteria bacterium]|nr:hypothetical protein [Pseudomonadota bacterium]
MKTRTNKHNIVYTNSEAETLSATQIPVITERIKTYSIDLAIKELPKLNDSLQMFLPMIHSLFQSLLEDTHKLLGAKRTQSDKQTIEENYAKEEIMLTTKTDDLEEDLRVLKKQEKEFDNNLGHHIRNWRVALFFLVLLSFSETMLNYKIFLPISSNNATALIGAASIAIAFFIICHVFKDILNFFETRAMKWLIGIGIISLVTGLLYSFAKMRLSFATDSETMSTEHVSEWNFVILNLTLFLSGIALTMIYKPSKTIVAAYNKHKILGDQIKVVSKEYKMNEQRLTVLLEEKNARLGELDGILLMAHHYEKSISAEYLKCFAMWCSENLIARKDKVQPIAFTEDPKPLTTYFDAIEFQTRTSIINTINLN